jgi:hypothetical protein
MDCNCVASLRSARIGGGRRTNMSTNVCLVAIRSILYIYSKLQFFGHNCGVCSLEIQILITRVIVTIVPTTVCAPHH